MAYVFLSDKWFAELDQPKVSELGEPVLNLVVTAGPDGNKKAHIAGTHIAPGHAEAAAATVTLPFDLAHDIFVAGNSQAAMPAITVGKIRVDGDVSALASIAHADSDELRELRNRLTAITEPLPPALVGPAAERASVSSESDRLGLQRYARELDINGYTLVPPEVTGVTGEFIDRVRERTTELAAVQSGTTPDTETGETHRNVVFPVLWYVLFEDQLFQEMVLNECGLALASYVLGNDYSLSFGFVWIKGPGDPPADGKLQLGLHCDIAGYQFPEPFLPPSFTLHCNIAWLLTDFSVEDGGTVFVPGSHYLCREPVGTEGQDRAVAVEAPKGTMMLWTGNTWHGALPRTKPGLRFMLSFGFCRPFMRPVQPYQEDVTEEILARHPARFAVLMGRTHPSGYRAEGLEALMATRAEAAARAALAQAGREAAVTYSE